jgi:hypothetical protein
VCRVSNLENKVLSFLHGKFPSYLITNVLFTRSLKNLFTFGRRVQTISILFKKNNKWKIGLQTLTNQVHLLGNILPFDWLNLRLNSFKI